VSRGSALASAGLLGFLALTGTASASGLTNAPALAAAYDAVLDADFDRVPALLDAACGKEWDTNGPRPHAGTPPFAAPPACRVLGVVSRWWQLQGDPLDRRQDSAFERQMTAAIADTEAWAAAEPTNAEPWFYVGAAYSVRVQFRVRRTQRLAAARDGTRIKDALERALELDPGMQDAWFGIGLYHYYAGVAPAAAKMLRWLLLLPGGDREAGLREMLRARDGAQLLRDEADYQLHTLYVWYEKQPEEALAIARRLQERHPHNPVFAEAAAEIEDVHLSDYASSLRSWQALHADVRAGHIAWPEATDVRARLGMATQLDRLSETDAAIEHLRVVLAAPAAPIGARAAATRQLDAALDRMKTPAYRLSIEGWRALERGDIPAAAQAIDRSLALAPNDQVTRYRKARVLLAQRSETSAIEALEGVIASPATPPHVYAAACLDAAQAYERHGGTARAVELYELTVAAFGVDPRAKNTARRALARLAKPA
jgi:tetratricopeptide (TPR) repeat protein